nr:putative ribonuclease H-like domain-containing protein [Tanacetum cinerariifolium]
MTGYMSYLTDYKEFDGGYVAFGGGAKAGKISGKGTIRIETKDETSGILKSSITKIENLFDIKVKIIRYDNGTEFKNGVMSEFCENKGKFDGKLDEGFFVGYSTNSKAFRVYNTRTRKVEENLHVEFLENKPMISCEGPKCLFDIDSLTKLMNYVPVVAGTNFNDFAGTQASIGSGISSKETWSSQDYILLPLWKDDLLYDSGNNGPEGGSGDSKRTEKENSTNNINTSSTNLNTGSTNINTVSLPVYNVSSSSYDPKVSPLRENTTFKGTCDYFYGDEADITNITPSYIVLTTPTIRIYKDHSLDNMISDIQSGIQTRRMTVTTDEQGFIIAIYKEKTHEDLHTCLFTCFLSQEEPKGSSMGRSNAIRTFTL